MILNFRAPARQLNSSSPLLPVGWWGWRRMRICVAAIARLRLPPRWLIRMRWLSPRYFIGGTFARSGRLSRARGRGWISRSSVARNGRRASPRRPGGRHDCPAKPQRKDSSIRSRRPCWCVISYARNSCRTSAACGATHGRRNCRKRAGSRVVGAVFGKRRPPRGRHDSAEIGCRGQSR